MSGWRKARLADIVDATKDGVEPRDFPRELFDYYSIPAYQSALGPMTERGEKILSVKLLVQDGTVLFGKLNPHVPKIWFVRSDSARRKLASTEFIPLLPKRGVDGRFLYFLCWSDFVLRPSLGLVSGSTPSRQRVDSRAFLSLEVPVPPLHEQVAIGEALESVDQARRATERVLAATRELTRSIRDHLFKYGPVNRSDAGTVSLKASEVGSIPEHWQVVPFSNGLSEKGFRVGKIKRSEYMATGRFPVIDQGQSFVAGYWDDETFSYHGPLPVVVFGDHTKAMKFVDFPFVSGADGTKVIVPNTEVFDPRFFFYALQRIDLESRGYNRHFRLLKESTLPCPPIREQRVIADVLTALEHKSNAELRLCAALRSTFDALLRELMSGARPLTQRMA